MSPATPSASRVRWPGWAAFAWAGFLLVVCQAPVLWALIRQWHSDDDMSHGFFVPVLAAYIAWQKRDQLRALEPRPDPRGLALVIYGALQFYVGTLGVELFLSRTAFVISLIGIVWFLGGLKILRVLAFPLLLLFFMVPIPALIYSRITLPLQLLASSLAEHALSLIGIPVLRRGNLLELAQQTLSIAEACSGIRSLLSLTFLSLIYGYFFENRRWMRIALFASTVPIAIAANAGRVTLTGLISQFKPEWAEGFLHTASGWVIFMTALAILVAFHRLLGRSWAYLHARP